jgi:sec1 family domain-containing protein 1
LRQHGITLNLPMEIQRSCVPNAPAIYFIEPTQKNIDGIVQDIQNNFYKEYYINFSSTADSELLEYFATTLPATVYFYIMIM